jgi:hypothetical protein
MPISQRQIVQECFDGDRERNCTYCPAHHSKTGICCFGCKFEYDDPQCHSCPHVSHCEPEAARYTGQSPYYGPSAQPSPPRRITINRPSTTTGFAPTPQTRATVPVYGQGHPVRRDGSIIVPQVRTARPILFPEDSFWRMMSLNAAWGAVEGALEMLLGFFRQRRPE